ncbi:flagellar biosynthesis repressor FlbT [Alsobacter sp. SYSU BS001988]
MPLRMELKPHERIIIGSIVLTNGSHRAHFTIEGDGMAILREKDIISPEDADTSCKTVYVVLEQIYVGDISPEEGERRYMALAREIMAAAPSTAIFFAEITKMLVCGEFYKALKCCRKLIEHEAVLTGAVAAA